MPIETAIFHVKNVKLCMLYDKRACRTGVIDITGYNAANCLSAFAGFG